MKTSQFGSLSCLKWGVIR